VELADIMHQPFHLFLLDYEILPIEHLNLCFILTLLEKSKKVADLLEDPVFLYNDVVFLF